MAGLEAESSSFGAGNPGLALGWGKDKEPAIPKVEAPARGAFIILLKSSIRACCSLVRGGAVPMASRKLKPDSDLTAPPVIRASFLPGENKLLKFNSAEVWAPNWASLPLPFK